MESLKYKIIKTRKQYAQYCSALEQLIESLPKSRQINEEIELLGFLIEKWDKDHNSLAEADPIVLLKSLMDDHKLRSKDLSDMLGVSKGLISDILNYKKGLSKEIIRALSSYFKVSQEAFNRPYPLHLQTNVSLKTSNAAKYAGGAR